MAALASALLLTPEVLAQRIPAPLAADPSTAPHIDPDNFLSRQVERVAILDLRTSASPQATDYGVATLLCEIAGAYAPDDVELVRRRAEAAWNWGDAAALDAATRRIIELDRRDTLAQLRLLSSRFSSMQTAEDKLAAFDRVGGSTDLDASVRSRFLLDASLLARERGDDAGFVRRLSRAIELDSSNKDAAVLALGFFEQRSDDRWGRLDLLTNLLLADPLDPQVHARLARECASGGAYQAARRFNRNVRTLIKQGGQSDTADSVIESTMLDILCDGPQRTYADFNNQIKDARETLASRLKILEAARQPTAGLLKPEDVRLDMDSEAIRITCALMMGDAPGTATSVHELGLTAHANVLKLMDPLQRPADMVEADAMDYARIAIARTELWRLATGYDLDQVEPDLAAALHDAKETDADARAIRAMVAARAGEYDKATQILGDASQDDPWLSIAAALSAELSGDILHAIQLYDAAREGSPVSPQGVLAGTLADRLHVAHSIPASPEQGATRRRLEDLAGQIDPWVDQVTRSAKSFEHLSAKLDQPEADALSPAYATITLRNLSPIPLALGAGKPLNSRLLIAQSVEVGGRSLTNLASAEVLDAQRRLRLLPGETIEIRYALDDGPTGWLLETMAAASGQVRLRVVQGFEIKANGAREPGPGCLETMSTTLQRRPLAEGRLKPGELAVLFEKADPAALAPLLIGARAAIVLPPPEGAQPIIDALVNRYAALPPKVRCLVVAAIPPASELHELAPLDEVISKEQDPIVLGLALVTRATSADSPLLAAALASGDAHLVRLATLHKSRLVEGVLCYASKGTGLVQPLRDFYGVSGPELPPAAPVAPAANSGDVSAPAQPR
jgi:hypothetical protein